MFLRRAVPLAVVLSALASLSARPVAAGTDVCPEPNGDLTTACFLGPDAPASGFIETPDDVDTYRLEVPPDSMIVVTLSGLPGDYTVHLRGADGSVRAEAAQVGTADKTVRADGLAAGSYFVSVASPRGASNTGASYLLKAAYQPTLILKSPTAPSGPRKAYEYVPPPARSYALQPDDVGAGFVEQAHEESNDGRNFMNLILAPDAQLTGDSLQPSNSTMTIVTSEIHIDAYGSDDEITRQYGRLLDGLRSRAGAVVEPAVGWSQSELVYSYAWRGRTAAGGETISRGIALKHRNAVAFVEISGLERLAGWGDVARLMRIVESRILLGVQ